MYVFVIYVYDKFCNVIILNGWNHEIPKGKSWFHPFIIYAFNNTESAGNNLSRTHDFIHLA